jgi:hypothetical protein
MSLANEDSLNPRDIFSRALRGWWLVALCFMLGAAAGLLVHSLRPAEYESSFGVPIDIDVTNTGELTQYEVDVAFELAGQILYKPVMREKVAAEARLEGIAIDAVQLRDRSTVERRLSTWRVRVRAHSPVEAEKLAGIWLRLGVEEIQSARLHAVTADGLKKRQQSLEECLSRAANAEPSQGLCSPLNLKDLQAQMNEASGLIVQERALSQGLPSGVVFGELPTQPEAARLVRFGRSEQVLGGGLIGLVIGVWAAQGEWARQIARRRRG